VILVEDFNEINEISENVKKIAGEVSKFVELG